MDLSYIQKGSQDEWEMTDEFNPDGNGKYMTIDDRYDFISFYPTAKFRLQKHSLAPYLFAGPRLDYYSGFHSNWPFSSEPSEIEAFTFGLSYGIGLDYEFDNFIFTIEAQHQPDLTSIISTSTSANNFGLDVRNVAFVGTVGIKYIL